MIRQLLVIPLALVFHFAGIFSLSALFLTAISALVIYRFVTRALGGVWVPRTGKCVLITGCDSGFGELTALRLDSMGVRVFAGCLTQAGAERLAKRSSSRIVPIIMNVTKDEDVKNAVDRITQAMLPGEKLWGVVNNAGIYVQGLAEFLTLDDYRQQMEVNYFGVLRVTKAFLPLIRNSKGRIVTIASVAGLFSFPELSAYCSSKYAVESVMDSLRREMYLWGVKVVLVEPGLHRTPLMKDLEKSARANIAALPAHIKGAYGTEFTDRILSIIGRMDSVPHGKPGAVCDTILAALFSSAPEARYQVGKDSIILLPLSYMPAWIQDPAYRLLERIADRQLPIPAGAR